MNLRSLFLLLVLSTIAAFAVLNWSVFITPTDLNLLVTSVHAPLGLVMLGLLGFLFALFLAYVVYLQTTVLIDSRAHAKELAANRRLADVAEASRFTELREYLDGELKRLGQGNQQSREEVLERVSALERSVQLAIEQSGNSLAASLGEMDERMRGLGPPRL